MWCLNSGNDENRKQAGDHKRDRQRISKTRQHDPKVGPAEAHPVDSGRVADTIFRSRSRKTGADKADS